MSGKRKKKRSSGSFFKLLFWILALIAGSYFSFQYLNRPPVIFYPGFQIEIPRGYTIHGIDVSRYQKIINWEEVKNMEEKGLKIGFAFMKATEGVSLVDEQFRRNWLRSDEHNIARGAYHFFIPGKNAKQQAENFMEIVNLKKGDLPPVLDIEIGRRFSVPDMQREVRIWLDAVEGKYGVKPILYTNIDFYQKYFQQGFEDYPLWIAHYLEPNKPRIENKWIFWQHSESGRVNGIKAPVDFNIFYGDSTDFKNLLIE